MDNSFQTKEMREVVSRISDLADQADRQGFITFSEFLSPPERAAAQLWLRKNKVEHSFCGGFEGAERQVCFLLPDYKSGQDLDDSEISEIIGALELRTTAKAASLTHRDFLGSLLGLGFRRSQIGDILVKENAAVVVCLTSISNYIEGNLEKIGSYTAVINRFNLQDIELPVRNSEKIKMTAASLRLDKIAAGGFGISRTQMADFIRGGHVMVDWLEETRPDREISQGMTISLKGHGRIIISSDEGFSRKNRHILIIERLI